MGQCRHLDECRMLMHICGGHQDRQDKDTLHDQLIQGIVAI